MASDEPVTEADLARLGIGAEAIPRLRALGIWDEHGALPGCGDVIRALADSVDAAHALRALVALSERRPDAWATVAAGADVLTRVTAVAGASDALGELLASDPDALTELIGGLEPRDVASVRQRASEVLDAAASAPHALATFQRRGLLRVAARDLTAVADTPTAAAELSDLAEGIISAAVDHLLADDPDVRLAVIGMGKLGGRELNYVSDVDVMFVCGSEWKAATKVAERLLRLLGEHTPAGVTYEVDANLRPEGRDGPLVRTLQAYDSYYERWAKTWEFQALLKARPLAGDRKLGERFSALAARYVWPDRLDPDQIAEIRRMKDAVERSRHVLRHGERQLKLAPGGLRDIEFAVQLLQLVHGRHDETLRTGNTLEALAALAEGSYVDEGDAQLFGDAYQFLRTVEHRLQLLRLRRTHTVPADDRERYRVARATGFRDIRAASALEQFDGEYQRVQGYVRRLHEKLFYRPLLERFAEIGAEERLATGEAGLAEEDARDRLAALGFADPDGALRHLDAMASGVSRRASLLRTILPALLPIFADAPDPDGGLVAFRSLAERLGASPAFVRTLRDNPPVGELLAGVLGSSRLVGEWLERQPEVLTLLSDLPGLESRLEAADYARLANGLLRRGQDEERIGAALRRLKRREAARIAVRDLAGLADVTDVAAELSGLAQACLEAGVVLTTPEDVRLAIIGLGKLGGVELGYASDLDILVVYAPDDARVEALRATERLLAVLGEVTPEGQAFRVDLNLRPEGKDGPLARSLESYQRYYERWGEDWELQALTQARHVAGDDALGAAFLDHVRGFVYPEQVPPSRLQAVRQMKARVERERANRGAGTSGRRLRPRRSPGRTAGQPGQPGQLRAGTGDRVDLKLGSGGLTDIEWTVQLLQLKLGGRLPALRQPGTLAAIEALRDASVLADRDATWLRDGWLLLTRVRNALYLAGQRDSSTLPANPRTQEHVARMLGYSAPGMQAFGDELGRTMRRVRKVHERSFYDA